jgi:hypothetical protein
MWSEWLMLFRKVSASVSGLLTRGTPSLALAAVLSFPAFAQNDAMRPYLDSALSPQQWAHDLVSRMTLEARPSRA